MFEHALSATTQIRELTREDLPELFTVFEINRVRLRQSLSWVDTVPDEAAMAARVETRQRSGALVCGIFVDGRLAGYLTHNHVETVHRSAAIGYWIDAAHTWRGLMTAAAGAFVRHSFAERGLHRLIIRCAVGNAKSRAVPERLGFRFEGVERDGSWHYDRFVDVAVYAKLASDEGR